MGRRNQRQEIRSRCGRGRGALEQPRVKRRRDSSRVRLQRRARSCVEAPGSERDGQARAGAPWSGEPRESDRNRGGRCHRAQKEGKRAGPLEVIRVPNLPRVSPRALDLSIVTAVVVTAFALRLINYSSIVAYPDEFVYTYRALATIGFHWDWSRQFMLDQPPIFIYLLGLITVVFNSQLETFRMLSVACGALTVGFVYLLGKSIINRTVGAI